MSIEAMKLALDKFESMGHKDSIFAGEFDQEISVLRQAIKQAEQAKPVACRIRWRNQNGPITGWIMVHDPRAVSDPDARMEVEPLYTHPTPAVVRQPLTEAQITFLHDMSRDGDYLDFARLIEAKHGIFEIAKVCPACGSTDTRMVSEYAGGEVVCTADQCDDCGHQWNVG